MAVQRSLGWSTTKKSITMTGQTSIRNNSIKSTISGQGFDSSAKFNRQLSTDTALDTNLEVEQLSKYSARKFSIKIPLKTKKTERTILDDYEYFLNKKPCEYGMCHCCQTKKPLPRTWQSIEEIIENDPEIIFDSHNNPIVVEPIRKTVSMSHL